MALRKILHYPNPRLRLPAEPVEAFDQALQQLIDDMFETMYEASGIGLAATQIDVQKRVIVIDLQDDKHEKLVLINPEIVETSGNRKMEEGCLSVPGIFEAVERPSHVVVKSYRPQGETFTIEAEDDLLAACLQHEIDHLNGKVFVDYLSPLKQKRIKKKLQKLSKEIL